MKTSTRTCTVAVKLKKRSYNVVIGDGLISNIGRHLQKAPAKRGVLLSDERLADARERILAALKQAGWRMAEIPLTAGESLKDFRRLPPLYEKMLAHGVDRDCTLFALGGGTLGDAAGFVASTYMRGIRWVGLPTTLLAQVDSAVGGKTAVNLPQGKNLVGTFHQPCLVLSDVSLLKTLSRRELISGLGETVKYGLIFDAKFFAYVRAQWEQVLKYDPGALTTVVAESIKWKAKAVERDEMDQSGHREILNFGHTFAHALEKLTSYESFQHGEAVVWGMRFALALSKVRRRFSAKAKSSAYEEAVAFLRSIPVPDLPPHPADQYFQAMRADKKVKNGRVRFVLLKSVGCAVVDDGVDFTYLRQAFNEMLGR